MNIREKLFPRSISLMALFASNENVQKLIENAEFNSFLSTTFIANPIKLTSTNTDVWSSQSDIVNRAISHLLYNSMNSNVLCLGYRKARQAAVSNSHYGVENYFPNTLVNHLINAKWSILLSWYFHALINSIGEEEMFHMLISAVLFMVVDGKKFIQLTGEPVSLKQEQKQKKPLLARHVMFYGHPVKSNLKVKFSLPRKWFSDFKTS